MNEQTRTAIRELLVSLDNIHLEITRATTQADKDRILRAFQLVHRHKVEAVRRAVEERE